MSVTPSNQLDAFSCKRKIDIFTIENELAIFAINFKEKFMEDNKNLSQIWQKRINQQRVSGKNIAAWCRENSPSSPTRLPAYDCCGVAGYQVAIPKIVAICARALLRRGAVRL